jgi:hypothetical protein
VRDQVSHPYKTTILKLIILENASVVHSYDQNKKNRTSL